MRRHIVMAGFVTLVLAANSFGGYAFTSVTKASGGRGAGGQDMKVSALVEGDKARIEFTESSNPVMGQGNYILTQDAGKTMFMVNPGEKSYMKWDIEAILGAAGNMMKMMGGMMQMEFSDPKVEKLTDEAGEPMLGLPTRHYRFRTTFSTTMTMLGHKSTTASQKDEEIWATTAIADPGMGAWLRKSPPKMGNEQLDKLVQAEVGKIQGFPLKQIMVNMTTDASGKQQTHTTVTEVTELKKTSVPAATFVMPADYTEIKMEAPATEGDAGAQKPAVSLPPALMRMMQKRQQPATP